MKTNMEFPPKKRGFGNCPLTNALDFPSLGDRVKSGLGFYFGILPPLADNASRM
jgi:hypothetical protein